ncbi:hypothetical protein KVR01_013187 [Diaporthe batatas]|uniref:uncharacterized protein n=1 Tax=Diaporthe batatas TaxID=748121 RepID=UPI001D03E870|nr:uncharacterized protein KVR01_013187 [Diaporthe batatas]KAG8156965.1 hypothetical protein KVR01_013187 [Diaporthe batatas]
MASEGASIKLYTNHGCPWAHRAHIVLAELGIPFEEEIIDLATPRTPEYLKVNPRGLVPSLSYNGEIITESAVVAQFLADKYPSHLLPASSDPNGPLTRARINFFVDAWFSKVNSFWFKALFSNTADESNENAEELVKGVVKEIEPLLKDAGPFFGGSSKLTLAEALTAPFVLRIKTYAKHGLLPASLTKDLQEKTPNFHKWSEAVVASPSVTKIFDVDANVARTKQRIERARA